MYICKNCFEKYVGQKPTESHVLEECSVCHSGDADEVTDYDMKFYTFIWENYIIDKRIENK